MEEEQKEFNEEFGTIPREKIESIEMRHRYIDNIVEEKYKSGQWDKGINGRETLTSDLLYDYATSIETLTKGKMSFEQVINKISTNMGKLRYKDFKEDVDDNVTYAIKNEKTGEWEDVPVTDEKYKKEIITYNTGAQSIIYDNDKNKKQTAVVLFDKEKQVIIDGKSQNLSGIDFNDLSDIRGTFFHEITHVMERVILHGKDIEKDDIIYNNGDSTYINAIVYKANTLQDYETYISNINQLSEVLYSGISGTEIKQKSDEVIRHNLVSEGVTESIARKVMDNIGDEVKHTDRYKNEVKIMEQIFDALGLENAIYIYFTKPQKISKILEEKQIEGKDALHYISDGMKSKGKSVSSIEDAKINIKNLCDELEKEKPLEKEIESIENEKGNSETINENETTNLNKKLTESYFDANLTTEDLNKSQKMIKKTIEKVKGNQEQVKESENVKGGHDDIQN